MGAKRTLSCFVIAYDGNVGRWLQQFVVDDEAILAPHLISPLSRPQAQ